MLFIIGVSNIDNSVVFHGAYDSISVETLSNVEKQSISRRFRVLGENYFLERRDAKRLIRDYLERQTSASVAQVEYLTKLLER